MSMEAENETGVVPEKESRNGFKPGSELEDSEPLKTVEETEPEVAESSAPAEKAASEPGTKIKNRSRLPFLIIASIILIGSIVGVIYWLNVRNYESTDDAFIEGDITQVSPKVSAYVRKIYFDSNQKVHKGDLLVELDPKDYEAKLEQAEAQLKAALAQKDQSRAQVALTRATTEASQTQARSGLEAAKNNVEQTRASAEAKQAQIRQAENAVKTAEANLAQTKTQVPQARANLDLAQKECDRRLVLFNNGDISKQSLDQATTALQSAQAQYNAAQKQVLAAQSKVREAQSNVSVARNNYRQSLAQIELTRSQVGQSVGQLEDADAAPERLGVSQTQMQTADAAIAQAEAAVHQAELELSYTKIYAPEDGVITRRTIEEGQLVQVGTPLMALSQSDDVWVIANFKETQLELMRVGQPVDIEIDAYPSEEFHGHIESFQAGTGSRFSLLPSENATGNYVKVVQRIPVKIVFDEKPDNLHLLAPGMSVEPSVKVR
ncbi:MAG: efflux RND transporter periplasmic adaptor subunit [Pyrinomonadaceae bacterium]